MTRVPISLRCLPVLALAALLALSPDRTARGGEDVLVPTPARSVDEVRRVMKKHGIKEVELTDEEKAVTETSLAGAITKQKGNRLGFMPLLQHHMAVEHWFLEGLTADMLGTGRIRTGQRIFVRLKGEARLTHMWSPMGGTDWYGNGLPHGKVYGSANTSVMGYHERVYRFRVEAVEWVRTGAEMDRLRDVYQGHADALKQAIGRGDWAEALDASEACRARKDDLGVYMFEDDSEAYRAYILLEGDAAAWTDEDVASIARAYGTGLQFRLRKPAWATFEKAVADLAAEPRERLARALTEEWRGLEYRHQKKALRENALSKLRGAAVAELEAEIAKAEAEIATLTTAFDAHIEAREFVEAMAVWKRIEPLHEKVLTYRFDKRQREKWFPALERGLALEQVWGDKARRLEALEKHILEAIESGLGLGNSSLRPRFALDLKEHFLPQLSERHKRRIEKMLIEIGERLDPVKDWKQFLLVGEMLVGVAGKAAENFMPRFIGRRGDAYPWQVKLLRQFQEEIERR